MTTLSLTEVTTPALPDEDWVDSLLTTLGRGLDTAVLEAMRRVVDATLMPRPENLHELRRSAAPFIDGELWDEPRSYFAFVDAPVYPVNVRGHESRRLRDGLIISRELTTDYQAHPSAASCAEWRQPERDRILVQHWTHGPERPRATIIALHGFSMGYPRLDTFALFVSQCFAAGFDVALMTLPFHGRRTPTGARFSGERFAAPDVTSFNEAVRQAVYEIHVLISWLQDHVAAPVGLLGLSLGGYLSALLAGLRSDLAFVLPMVPPVCIGDLGWRFFERSRHHRRDRTAFSHQELRAAYRIHSPLTYRLQVAKEQVAILAGRGDQIVPPDHPHTLWRHWGEPNIHWFSGSHLAPFRRRRLCTVILSHLDRCADLTAS